MKKTKIVKTVKVYALATLQVASCASIIGLGAVYGWYCIKNSVEDTIAKGTARGIITEKKWCLQALEELEKSQGEESEGEE